MVRRVTPAQYRSMVRQAQARQKQAIDKYNQGVRKYNRELESAVANYNREVRAHNARVRVNRQRLQTQLRRLQSQPNATAYVRYRTSVRALTTSFERVDAAVESRPVSQEMVDLAELSEGEAANSVQVLNALLDDSPDVADDMTLRAPTIEAELASFSQDLALRWRGALFSLNPANPDAGRHFCTSAREILTMIIQSSATDAEVIAGDPSCQRARNGAPTRRARVRHLLARKGVSEQELEDFVEADLDNVLELFETFNSGTHGAAGRYTVRQLVAIRQRVESAIVFLHRIVYAR